MKITTRAVMSVYDFSTHRTSGNTDFCRASIVTKNDAGVVIFDRMLEQLQRRGVKPGTKLRITVETL